ncbi:OmpA family protein [Vibrio sp. PNB22_3_1]
MSAEPLTDVRWVVNESLYRCELEARLPSKSLDVRIAVEPESPMSLSLHARGFEIIEEDASIQLVSPFWKQQGIHIEHVLPIDNRQDKRLYSESGIQKVLDLVSDGFWLTLEDGERYLPFPSVDVNDLAQQFYECRDSMPLILFDTARETHFYFDSGRGEKIETFGLDRTLDGLVSVIDKDKSVTKILIDGYTDSLGDDVENLELSKKRASYVALQLANRGVSAKKIEIRAHGERYAEHDNGTFEGRRLNRKVTVRLVRIGAQD